ncbi:TPA: hypothetical protein ACY3ID_004168 [Citrobacter amalonaticus]|uniref:hypothetical protein n=1 Tax=Citrobacter TaxID=544 RepID=UPI001242FA14|nr:MULTISPECIES: hypothetical protein [Citrobacter]QIO40718.1 hypothetical protein HAP28_17645 [Citrobacter sp. Y3]
MSVNGQDFYDFALKCVAQGDEISLRNAVGRAYYGVYHDVCEKLHKCPQPPTHHGVSDYLIETAWLTGYEPYDKMKLISLGTMLKSLHVQRKWADYNLEADYTKTDAEATLIMAKKGMEKSKAMYEEKFPSAPAPTPAA